MEKVPVGKINNAENAALKIDKESLESQLEKVSKVLENISEHYSFSTFSHFEKLAELADATNDRNYSGLELLDQWNYDCLNFIENEGDGNCVDFAVLGQKLLSDAGIPTAIIGKLPPREEFSKDQIDFMQYRHTSLLYLNGAGDECKMFMFEPGWKFPKAIAINPLVVSRNDDWEFQTLEMKPNQFTQRTYNIHKNKHGQRTFDTRPLDIAYCRDLTKRLVRVPRKLEMVNKLSAGVPTSYIRFDPYSGKFTSNNKSIDGEFIPEDLTLAQKEALDTSFDREGLSDSLKRIMEFRKSLPKEFWITRD